MNDDNTQSEQIYIFDAPIIEEQKDESVFEPTVIYEFNGPYRFLSNFYVITEGVAYEGMFAYTTEHIFQAAKTNDPQERQVVLDSSTPGIAKRAGRRVTLVDNWDDIRINVMHGILKAKFTNPRLQKMLLETGNARLIEGNHWGDTFWGVDSRNGRGANHLGKLLEEVRAECRAA